MFKPLQKALETVRVFEGGKISLTNILLVFSAVLIYLQASLEASAAFGLMIISYNIKRYLNYREKLTEMRILERTRARAVREDEEYQRLKAQVSALETQVGLMNRGF